VVQIELLPKPPECRSKDFPWPSYPAILKTTSSHEEGGRRDWLVLTQRFMGEKGSVKSLSCVRVKFQKNSTGCLDIQKISGSEFQIEADLVVLALGFLYPQKQGLIEQLRLELDERGNVKTDNNFMTSVKNIFSCGDMHRGQSLVVWAIAEGRRAAYHIDKYLMGTSNLPVI
jgi:glutamate synthase (NADPH/NADH) small chain